MSIVLIVIKPVSDRRGLAVVHKLYGETAVSLLSSVLCGASGGVASGYWKYVSCKKCLSRKRKQGKKSSE